jgi:nucleotide-binding universal stress UspA family protein
MRFRTILCPVDFSSPSRLALRCAAAVARLSAGEITVLYVEDPLLSAAASAARFDTALLAKQTNAELTRFARGALAGCRVPARAVRFLVLIGRPAKEIPAAAVRLGADVIVMGTRGLGRARGFVLGSTTEAVLAKARVPVMAVPPGSARSVGRPSQRR